MNILLALKLIIAVFLLLLFFVTAYKSRTAGSALTVVGVIFLELVVTLALIWGISWGLDVGLKKATLVEFKHTRITSQEKIIISGAVKNTGKFPINTLYINIKIINAVSAGAQQSAGRDNTLNETITIRLARPLIPGMTERFTKTIKYPPYFRLAGSPMTKLWWD